ncbi:hypothetical protein A2U01_0062478, partial [Trifolium medium]|nr:hypothetical protein [Trifolium medium]
YYDDHVVAGTLSSTESDDISSYLVICRYYDDHVVAGTLCSTECDPISAGEKTGILFAGICLSRLLLSSTPRWLATACSALT